MNFFCKLDPGTAQFIALDHTIIKWRCSIVADGFHLLLFLIRGGVKKVVLLGGAHHKVAYLPPLPSCGQSTTFLWDFFLA